VEKGGYKENVNPEDTFEHTPVDDTIREENKTKKRQPEGWEGKVF
jgi:hypothetical protein